jgi:iron complex outermembrane receptor protein
VVQQSATIASKSSHPSTTWKIGFEHDLAADSMLYGTVATGFKSGGVQIRRNDLPITGLSPLPLGGYDNETSVSFEVGSKNRFLDNRFQVNGAVFYTRWDKMQLNTFVCITPGCIPFNQPTYTTWFNAGPSTQYGLELDTVWAVTSNDRVNFSATFMHGAYGKADYDWGAPNTQGGFDGHVHLGGRAMAQTPAAAANAAYSHAFHIGEGKLTTTLEGEYSAKYETTHEYFFAGHTQPSYFRTNASVTYEQGKVNINAFVRNAQNKSTIQSVFPFGVQGGEPRLYGASLQVAF